MHCKYPKLPWSIFCLGMALIMVMGCTRGYYREQADCQAYQLIREKTCPDGWPLEGYTIDIDPMSRMFDPFCPDCPPMPPDDPAAHKYMHCVYCMEGWPCWHCNGNTQHVENPDWRQCLPTCAEGTVLIDEHLAIQLALLHSPEFQVELEDLYLSALDVSFERFRFDAQFFGGTGLTFTADGRDRNGTGTSSSLLDLSSRNIQMRKLFAGGGELVIGLANSLLWQFAGPNTNAATTLLDFSFVQPLLRLGGRDFVLERLTIAERALLANVRQMERFRRGYYVQIITGANAGAGPSRRGGVFGGSGLEGFSGVGGGGFGQLGGGGGNFGVTGGAGAGQAGGYLGLLQSQQDIRNQQANIAALESSVAQLDAFFRAGRIDYFQVELARQALFNGQSRLLNSRLQFQNSKDGFKLDLGLPPSIKIEIDDQLIKPFQLVDPAAVKWQNELTRIQREVGQAIIQIIQLTQPSGAAGFGPNVEATSAESVEKGPIYAASYLQTLDGEPAVENIPDADAETSGDEAPSETSQPPSVERSLGEIKQLLEGARELCNVCVSEGLPQAMKDIGGLEGGLDGRAETMRQLRELLEVRLAEQAEVCGDEPPPPVDVDAVLPFEPARLEQLPSQLEGTLGEIEKQFQAISNELDAVLSEIERLSDQPGDNLNLQRLGEQVLARGPNTLNDLSANLLSMILVQVRARTQNASLVPIQLHWSDAVQTARERRRDWMNARAALVDAWRLIQFNSDALQSDLNLIFNGDVSNVGDNPLDLRSSTGRLQFGVQFDSPITRLSERNTYRQALIEYQQARRSYYQFVDGVSTGLRTILRGLEVNQVNFELRRAAVEVAIAQVELARLRLQEPPKPNEDANLGATTARDLVSALSDLLNVQNDFLSVWINHESLRRQLDFNLGTMELDACSIWIDPGAIYGGLLPAMAGADCELLDADIGLEGMNLDNPVFEGATDNDPGTLPFPSTAPAFDPTSESDPAGMAPQSTVPAILPQNRAGTAVPDAMSFEGAQPALVEQAEVGKVPVSADQLGVFQELTNGGSAHQLVDSVLETTTEAGNVGRIPTLVDQTDDPRVP